MRLKRSQAPLPQKIQSLPIVFWSDALHGLSGNVGSQQLLQSLRTKALANLGIRKAGLNSLLRLSLEDTMTADPGFYQVRHTIFHFRRMCRKMPCFVLQWQLHFARYDGRSLGGPFTALMGCLSLLGWSVAGPPLIWHTDGFEFDLLSLDNRALDRLLHRAWLRHVAYQISTRTTFEGLGSLDMSLCKIGEGCLNAMQKAQVRALQAGAFLSPWQQAKFDTTATERCPTCGAPDTQKHWLRCERYAHHRIEAQLESSSIDSLPDFAALHLLGPESPALAEFHAWLLALPVDAEYLSAPTSGVQHVFTDGSHIIYEPAGVSLASWGIVNATANNVVAAGHVPGLGQTIGRAELTAIIHAMRWGLSYHVSICVWSDAASVVQRLRRFLKGDTSCLLTSLDNHDLWDDAAALVAQFEPSQLRLEWVPSHLDEAKCDDLGMEWASRWNGIVDEVAGQHIRALPTSLQGILDALSKHQSLWQSKLQALKKFYLLVAAERYEDTTASGPSSTAHEPVTIDDTDWGAVVGHLALSDHFPAELPQCFVQKYPLVHLRLAQTLIAHLPRLEDANSDYAPISFIELSLFLIQFDDFVLPGQGLQADSWSWRHPASMFVRPTLAYIVQIVRRTLLALCDHFGARDFIVRGINRSGSRILTRCDGVVLKPSLVQLHAMSKMVEEFNSRGIRRACDLARPCL